MAMPTPATASEAYSARLRFNPVEISVTPTATPIEEMMIPTNPMWGVENQSLRSI